MQAAAGWKIRRRHDEDRGCRRSARSQPQRHPGGHQRQQPFGKLHRRGVVIGGTAKACRCCGSAPFRRLAGSSASWGAICGKAIATASVRSKAMRRGLCADTPALDTRLGTKPPVRVLKSQTQRKLTTSTGPALLPPHPLPWTGRACFPVRSCLPQRQPSSAVRRMLLETGADAAGGFLESVGEAFDRDLPGHCSSEVSERQYRVGALARQCDRH